MGGGGAGAARHAARPGSLPPPLVKGGLQVSVHGVIDVVVLPARRRQRAAALRLLHYRPDLCLRLRGAGGGAGKRHGEQVGAETWVGAVREGPGPWGADTEALGCMGLGWGAQPRRQDPPQHPGTPPWHPWAAPRRTWLPAGGMRMLSFISLTPGGKSFMYQGWSWISLIVIRLRGSAGVGWGVCVRWW